MKAERGETPFLKNLGKALVGGSFASRPLQPSILTAITAIFSSGRCLSISIAAPEEIFISSISNLGISGSCPILCLQPNRGTLLGIVAAELCGRIIDSRNSSFNGHTGLSDVDYAASEFGGNAMISVPILDPAKAESISGVLSLGYRIEELASELQSARYRADCMCRVLVEIGKGMAPYLSEQAARVISNLTPCILPWPPPHPLSCTCELCRSRLGEISEQIEPAEPKQGSERGTTCREGGLGGSDSDPDLDPGMNRVPAGGGESSSDQRQETSQSTGVTAAERGDNLGGALKKRSSKLLRMHPFWLSFSDRAVEAKFAAWFAAWMHKIDVISHMVMLALLFLSAAKQLFSAAQNGNHQYFRGHLGTIAFFSFRIAVMVLASKWYIKHRDVLLMATPMLTPFMMKDRVPPAGYWPNQKMENIVWMARSLYVAIFVILTLCTMVRFRVSAHLYLFCAVCSLGQLWHVCGAPTFQSVPTAVCIPWGISILAAGLVVPHCFTWAYERRTRQIWMARHVD